MSQYQWNRYIQVNQYRYMNTIACIYILPKVLSTHLLTVCLAYCFLETIKLIHSLWLHLFDLISTRNDFLNTSPVHWMLPLFVDGLYLHRNLVHQELMFPIFLSSSHSPSFTTSYWLNILLHMLCVFNLFLWIYYMHQI